MSPLLSLLLCLLVHLCVGDQPAEEVHPPKKVHLLGSWTERSPESAEVHEATQYAVKMYNSHSKSKKVFKLISITAAKTQVTNMLNFKINAILGKTKCLKTENHELESCILEKKHLKCSFDVAFNPRNGKHKMHGQECTRVTKQV